MKVTLMYDEDGVIQSVASVAEDLEGEMVLEPEPGQRAVEVDCSRLGLQSRELTGERLGPTLVDLPRRFRVEKGEVQRIAEKAG
ncbi:MAG: hypothetical protein AAGN66_15390 [Acidobacteriota bacterium]